MKEHRANAVCIFAFIAAMATLAYGQTEIRSAVPIDLSTVGYPDEAIRTGLDGRVKVNVTVNKKGRVTGVNRVTGPGFVCSQVMRADVVAMRKAASEAAMRATFEPATEGGKAVESTITINYDFAKPPSAKTETPESQTFVTGRAINDRAGSNTGKPSMLSSSVLNRTARTISKPNYSAAASALGLSGSVSVEILIDTDGTVFSAEPKSGHPLLQAASTSAACESTFAPTLLEGKPVRVSGIIVYNFVP